ncbi:MAG: hypothetical protein O2954_19825, partial [bacterium]|nr:hypothetical protein [bacterium]
MELPEINDAIIHARSTSHSYTRGEEYFQSGCVSNLIIEGETAHAIVYGRKRYPVKIWGRGSTIKTACACRYEGEGICRHAVAVMLSIARQNSGQTPFQWYEYGTRTTPPQDRSQQM